MSDTIVVLSKRESLFLVIQLQLKQRNCWRRKKIKRNDTFYFYFTFKKQSKENKKKKVLNRKEEK